LEENVPEEGRILFLWEPRSYYSPRPTQPDAILDNWSHLLYRYNHESQVAAYLQDQGVTHVLLYQRGLDFVIEAGESPLPSEDVGRLNTFIKQYLTAIETIGSYRLYRLKK
jgi:hypothetical protein